MSKTFLYFNDMNSLNTFVEKWDDKLGEKIASKVKPILQMDEELLNELLKKRSFAADIKQHTNYFSVEEGVEHKRSDNPAQDRSYAAREAQALSALETQRTLNKHQNLRGCAPLVVPTLVLGAVAGISYIGCEMAKTLEKVPNRRNVTEDAANDTLPHSNTIKKKLDDAKAPSKERDR